MSRTIIIVSICFFTLTACKLQPNTENQIIPRQLQKIYDSTAQNDQSYIAFVIDSDPHDFSSQLSSYISKRANGLSIVLSTNGQCNWVILEKSLHEDSLGHNEIIYMFVDPTVAALNSTLSCLEQLTIWRPRTRTVLVFSTSANADTITDIFRRCWQLKMLNTVAIAPDHSQITILGFNPFTNQFYIPLNDDEIFYDKLANLYGFKINILLTEPDDTAKVRVVTTASNETRYTGKDAGTILSTLQYYNATYGVLDIQKKLGWANPFRIFHRNSKHAERQQILTDNHIDLFFLSQEMRLGNNITEMHYPHSKDDWVFLIPRAGFISQYEQLLHFFQAGFSLFLIFFLLVCPVVWFAVRLTEAWLTGQRRRLKLNVLLRLFFENFKLILGASTDELFPNIVERIFLVVLCLCYLVINNYFQSILMSIMTVQTRLPQINTIDGMIASNHIVDTTDDVALEIGTLFNNTRQAGIFKKLRPRRPTMLHTRPNPYNFQRNRSFLVPKDYADMWHVKRPYFRVCRESPLPAYIAFHVTKNSPYFDLIAKTIPRVLESGLYYFWLRDSLFMEILQEGVLYEEDDENWDAKSLSIYQFRAAVYLLFFGLTFGVSVFLIELVCYYTNRQSCRREIQENNI